MSAMDSWRVAVLGDGGVGKTALAVQFTLNCFIGTDLLGPAHPTHSYFQQTYDPTIEDAYRKQLVVDNRVCFVEVIDTAGQEEYASLRDQWVREGQGFILVYSIASRSTFDRLEIFRQLIFKIKRSKPVAIILVGNKCDKAYEREVSRDEGLALARTFECPFLETSAKDAINVERLFMDIVRACRRTRQDTAITPPPVAIVEPKKKSKSKCTIL